MHLQGVSPGWALVEAIACSRAFFSRVFRRVFGFRKASWFTRACWACRSIEMVPKRLGITSEEVVRLPDARAKVKEQGVSQKG